MRHMRIWRYVDEVARTGSLRRAAVRLNMNASALQRRIQDVEEDLGAPLFERLPTGMRLTAAGEAFIRWVRSQAADLERVQSQIEDLAGMRRGRVRIACSQAVAAFLLPQEIARFTNAHPLVHFAVAVRDSTSAVAMLREYEAELALVFQPGRSPDFEPMTTIGQSLVAVMAKDHPLATRSRLRLRECAGYPLALLDHSFGGRQILDDHIAQGSIRLDVRVEASSFEFLRNYVAETDAITLQIDLGAMAGMTDGRLVRRPIDARDGLEGALVLGRLRSRNLPVAAAKFAERLSRRLHELASDTDLTGP